MTLADQHWHASHDVVYHALLLTGLPGRTPTADVVAQHAAHLAELDAAGKLVLAGPFLGRFAGLLVLRTASVAEAIRIAEEDPMIRGGFQSYEVVPWAQATSRNGYQPNLTQGSEPMSVQPIKIGYSLSLTGPLASNGRTARVAHQMWEDDVNRRGGLLGRPVHMICVDDETNPQLVRGIYKRLLDDEKVDLVIGGYGDNSVAPAMPLIMERERYLVALMALAVNAGFGYDRYFTMIPTGPFPTDALTEGFFDLAGKQSPRPSSMAILAADAPFSAGPVAGARRHADALGFRVVADVRYPLTTADFESLIRQLEPLSPDILFLCSYLKDSAGLLRAIDAVGLEPGIVGGAMIGPQNGSVKLELGPVLNGVVNYEYWLPAPAMMYSGVAQLIADYQKRAAVAGSDPLGYYVVPQAFAQMQIVEQAIVGTGSLDDAKLALFTRDNSFKTVVGDVKFGPGGGWAEPRVLQVQYQNINSHDVADFIDTRTQSVVWPPNLASGTLVYPYAKAKGHSHA